MCLQMARPGSLAKVHPAGLFPFHESRGDPSTSALTNCSHFWITSFLELSQPLIAGVKVFLMAKKTTPNAKDEPTEQINAYIPADMKRRMKIAAANTGKKMTELLVEWIESGLASVEKAVAKKG